MGIETAALVVAAVAAVGGATTSIIAGNQQRAAARHAADDQRQAQEIQNADNATKQAAERRQQIRDERIRIARVQQAAANTGTESSSGELGAIGSITTQTNNNIGINLGAAQRGTDISILNQDAADSIFQGQQAAGTTGAFGSIFGALGAGASAYTNATKTIKPVPTQET
jgi:hypothetical protein